MEYSKYEQERLERVTRITGNIPKDYGVLLIKFNTYFDYSNDVDMSIVLRAFNGFPSTNNENWEICLANSSKEETDKVVMKSIVKRPYPNKSYVSLVAKNCRKHADDGVPYLASIEDLNAINEIEFNFWDKKDDLSVSRKFSFPVKIEMSSENKLACLLFRDYGERNNKRDIDERDVTIKFQTFIDVRSGAAHIASWNWTPYDLVQQQLTKKWDDQFNRDNLTGIRFEENPNPDYWLTEPEWLFYAADDSDVVNVDDYFLGLSFYKERLYASDKER